MITALYKSTYLLTYLFIYDVIKPLSCRYTCSVSILVFIGTKIVKKCSRNARVMSKTKWHVFMAHSVVMYRLYLPISVT